MTLNLLKGILATGMVVAVILGAAPGARRGRTDAPRRIRQSAKAEAWIRRRRRRALQEWALAGAREVRMVGRGVPGQSPSGRRFS
jgi:hypothetical protein